MEVALKTADVPEDAIISIRAGSVRREAPLSAGNPFKFLKDAAAESLLKVDILKRIASGYVVLKPNETSYRVVLEQGSTMSCEVDVNLGEAVESNAAEEGKDAASAKEAKDELALGVLFAEVLQQPRRALAPPPRELPDLDHQDLAPVFLQDDQAVRVAILAEFHDAPAWWWRPSHMTFGAALRPPEATRVMRATPRSSRERRTPATLGSARGPYANSVLSAQVLVTTPAPLPRCGLHGSPCA